MTSASKGSCSEASASASTDDARDVRDAGAWQWLLVVLGLTNTLLFSSTLSGWASLQSFLEDDGVYADLCAGTAGTAGTAGCVARESRMIFMYSRGQMMAIFAYAFFNLLDRLGPIFFCVLGGFLETAGLLLLATTSSSAGSGEVTSVDWFDVAVALVGVGGSALMVHALKLPFLVSSFAQVMTLVNCMVDGSSVLPAVLYQLYRWGMSRREIFLTYGSCCLLLNGGLALTWLPSLPRLAAKRSAEGHYGPRLHGLPLIKQVQSFEFAFALIMFTTQGFAANSYLGFNKNLLSSLGDDENLYTRVFCLLLPASIFFAPLYGMSLNRFGFAFSFAVTLFLGLLWSCITLVPSLPVQVIAFLCFTNYRALLYSAYFTFIAHSFGSRTLGAVNAQLSTLAALLTWLVGPCTTLSETWFGSLAGMSWLIIVLLLPPSLMTLRLSQHLTQHPSGDIRLRRDSKSTGQDVE